MATLHEFHHPGNCQELHGLLFEFLSMFKWTFAYSSKLPQARTTCPKVTDSIKLGSLFSRRLEVTSKTVSSVPVLAFRQGSVFG